MTVEARPRATVVLDVGKTHVKLRALDARGQVLEGHDRDNRPVMAPQGYPALDTAGIEDWLSSGLASLAQRVHVERLIASTHGAAFAALDAQGLVLPIVDYEFDAYEGQRAAYAEAVGALDETLSPHLPMGLNAARAWYWQSREFPQAFARATTLLPYPQYWAWRLCGVAASEASSLGCHTHLWAPRRRAASRLAVREGWAPRLAPLRAAWDELGPLRPELARRLGLPTDCIVHAGVHDSNACLARHLRHAPAMTLVTSGTWTVVMACGGRVEALDLSADMLANVSVAQDLVPTARFMGGRDHEALCDGASPDAAQSSLAATLDVRVEPDAAGGRPHVWRGREDITAQLPRHLDSAQRATLAALHCARMTAQRVRALTGPSPVVIDGPLARNRVYGEMLAGLLPDHVCRVADGADGTLRGAWALAHWGETAGG